MGEEIFKKSKKKFGLIAKRDFKLSRRGTVFVKVKKNEDVSHLDNNKQQVLKFYCVI